MKVDFNFRKDAVDIILKDTTFALSVDMTMVSGFVYHYFPFVLVNPQLIHQFQLAFNNPKTSSFSLEALQIINARFQS
jgi:hypothetical protein